ncbi:MAG: hypothetical protein IAE91_01020, partial [Ignavibacteriaceae bacterium]|nr:hypothetical protein [Ignavibacteriaceae bacterium]
DLSMNLLGGKFKEEHIKYRVISKESSPGAIKFKTINHPVIFFNFNDIHELEIPYKKKFQEIPKELRVKLSLLNRDDITLHSKTEVKHKPEYFNYWHTTLTLLLSKENKRLENTKPAFAKQIALDLLNSLRYKAKKSINSVDKIPEEFYSRIK